MENEMKIKEMQDELDLNWDKAASELQNKWNQKEFNTVFEIMLGDLDDRLRIMEARLTELMQNVKYKK